MSFEKAKIVKDNLAAFWTTCFSTNSNFQILNKDNIFHTVSDIDDPLMNAVLSSSFKPDQITDSVNNIQSYYTDKGLSFCWWIDASIDSPKLIEQLQNNQFIAFGDVSGMVMSLESPSTASPTLADIEITQVTTFDDLKNWVAPIQISFGMSEASKEKYLTIFEKLNETSNGLLHFVAKHQGKIIGSSTLFFDKVAGIYNCATLPEYRGKGILSLLTAIMLNKARTLGYKQVTLQASPMSVSTFRKHGFEDVVPYQVYLKPRA